MQFPVPQYIDIEDTIVGPLSVKQTIIFAIGVMIIFMSMMIFVVSITIIIAIPTTIVTLLFAFYKPNGRPLYVLVTNYFIYHFRPKLYIWRREPEGILIKRAIKREAPNNRMSAEYKIVSRNRLQELAWVLDTQQAISPEGEEVRESA